MGKETSTPIKAGRRNAGTVFPTKAIAEKDSSVKIMQFPSDLGTHQFIMNFVRFSLAGKAQPPNTDVMTSIALPVPGQGITDKIGVKYNQDELGIVGGSLIGAVASAANAVDQAKALDPVSLSAEGALKTMIQAGAGAGQSWVDISHTCPSCHKRHHRLLNNQQPASQPAAQAVD